MKINNKEVIGNKFFFDDCHKIYIIEDDQDIEDMKKKDWTNEDIYPIEELEETYRNACSLKFISNCKFGKLEKQYVKQFENENNVVFTN